jgi:hypothetical protein
LDEIIAIGERYEPGEFRLFVGGDSHNSGIFGL